MMNDTVDGRADSSFTSNEEACLIRSLRRLASLHNYAHVGQHSRLLTSCNRSVST